MKVESSTGDRVDKSKKMACWPCSTRVYKSILMYTVYEFNQQESWAFLLHMFRSRHVRFSTCMKFMSESEEKTENLRIMTHCPGLRTSTEKHYITRYYKSTNSTGSSGLLARAMCQSPPRSLFLCFARSQGVTAEPTRKFFSISS